MLDTSRLAREQALKNIMVSNGFINLDPLKELCPVLDAANIDLKTFDPEAYLKLTGGKLDPVLETLKTLKNRGVWLEITNLIVPSWTDDAATIKRMCVWLFEHGFADTPLHFSRFHPQYKLTRLPATPLQTLSMAREIALEAGLRFVYIGNVPGTGGEDTYCPSCKKLLVRRRGFTVSENHIERGACSFCSGAIPGVWTV